MIIENGFTSLFIRAVHSMVYNTFVHLNVYTRGGPLRAVSSDHFRLNTFDKSRA